MEQFHLLKQTTTVSNYIDNFEEHMLLMKRDHPYLTDNFFLLRFLAGLKGSVKHSVKSHNPSISVLHIGIHDSKSKHI
jgi:hypothetical protein